MAKKPPVEEITLEVAADLNSVQGYVVLENLKGYEIDIPLRDGTTVALGPRSKRDSYHLSEPILKKLLPNYVRNLVSKGDIKLNEAGR